MLQPQTEWRDPPAQVPARDGFVDVPGARLKYWDTGGDGEAIVLLHPATGSAMVWPYQQPAFTSAGYRVIAYSRRGHAGSERGEPADFGTAAGDLLALADRLALAKFHLLGSAAGGFVAADFAISHPERLASLILASTQGGGQDPEYRTAIARIAPPEFVREMPSSFRELGPSYRAANPQGMAAWEALEHASLNGPRIRQPFENQLTWDRIATISAPTLMFTGDADLYIPPALMQVYAAHIATCETAIVPGSGHSAYWEQPDIFNRLVLDFVARHSAR